MGELEAPEGIPLDRPSVARIYDYYLGGYHNFAVDRRAAEAVLKVYPDMPLVMRINRAFLRRSVRYLLSQGIDQFLDLGSGIPTVGNVHELTAVANPTARVVYVDIDPVAIAHSESILAGNPQAIAVQADVTRVEALLDLPEIREFLDFERPIGVLLLAFLHFVVDYAQAQGIGQTLHRRTAPGSFIALTHACQEGVPEQAIQDLITCYSRSASPVVARSREQIAGLFAGFELIEPGVMHSPLWRPESAEDLALDQPWRAIALAGVGRR